MAGHLLPKSHQLFLKWEKGNPRLCNKARNGRDVGPPQEDLANRMKKEQFFCLKVHTNKSWRWKEHAPDCCTASQDHL